MCLSCKHVDDVVIGAPFILTEDLINCLGINKVIHVTGTEEDKVLKRFDTIEPLQVAKDLGIYK